MNIVRTARRSTLTMTALCLFVGRPANTQQPVAGTGSSISRAPDPRTSLDIPETSPADLHHLEKARQADRQRRMIADTARLLALTADLKASMDKTAASKDQPPADLIKKTEEIERLARSVKERMKG